MSFTSVLTGGKLTSSESCRLELLVEFGERLHRASDVQRLAQKWAEVLEATLWNSFSEVSATFSTASYVDPFVVFNLGGNKYRIATLIDFDENIVLITNIMTHEEYDRGRWRQ